jgi:hypothetical protein
MMEWVGYGMVAPAAVSIAAVYLCRKGLPRTVGARYALAVALATGFTVGFALLVPREEWIPSRHWHWLPYLTLAAAVLGPIGLARGVWVVEQWLLALLLAITSAWFLVPGWESLEATRPWYVGGLAVYLLVLNTFLASLANRVAPKLLLAVLASAALMLAVMILPAVSLRYGFLSGAGAAAMVACLGASYSTCSATTVRGLVPVYTVLVGGWAFVAFIEPQPPLPGLLLLSAAPMALWITAWRASSNEGRLATVMQLAAAAAVSAVGIGWTMLAS